MSVTIMFSIFFILCAFLLLAFWVKLLLIGIHIFIYFKNYIWLLFVATVIPIDGFSSIFDYFTKSELYGFLFLIEHFWLSLVSTHIFLHFANLLTLGQWSSSIRFREKFFHDHHSFIMDENNKLCWIYCYIWITHKFFINYR
jgi:hypothetical protein